MMQVDIILVLAVWISLSNDDKLELSIKSVLEILSNVLRIISKKPALA